MDRLYTSETDVFRPHILTYEEVIEALLKRTLSDHSKLSQWRNERVNIGLNPLTAGAAYLRVYIFYYHLLNMLKIKCDINLKTVDLHVVKSE